VNFTAARHSTAHKRPIRFRRISRLT